MSRWRVWSMIYWQLFLFNGKIHLSRNQTTGKFFSGTAKWPFDLYLAKHFFFFFFFLNQNWVCVLLQKRFCSSVRWCLLRQHKQFLHAVSVTGFRSGWWKESSSSLIRNDSRGFQLSEQHSCGVVQRVGASLWRQCAWFTSWSCPFLSVWTLASYQPPRALTFSSVKCSCEQYCAVDFLLELNTLVCVKL